MPTDQSFVGDDSVVLHSAAQVQLVGFVSSPFRQIPAHARMVQNRLLALIGRQRGHERQALQFLILKQFQTRVRSRVDMGRLGPHKGG